MSVETYATTKRVLFVISNMFSSLKFRVKFFIYLSIGFLQGFYADRAALLIDKGSFHACCVTVCIFAPGEHIMPQRLHL